MEFIIKFIACLIVRFFLVWTSERSLLDHTSFLSMLRPGNRATAPRQADSWHRQKPFAFLLKSPTPDGQNSSNHALLAERKRTRNLPQAAN